MSTIYVDEQPALYFEDYGYALASYHTLHELPLHEIVDMAKANASKRAHVTTTPDMPDWPLWIAVDYTAPEFFRDVAAQQYVRPQSGVKFIIEEDGSFYASIAINRRSSNLEWPEMERLLATWSQEHGIELDQLSLYHPGHPHNWEAHFQYPHMQHSVEQACTFANDAMGFVTAFESGSLNRVNLVAVLNSGQASLLIGMSERV